jgi:hypothetical protein
LSLFKRAESSSSILPDFHLKNPQNIKPQAGEGTEATKVVITALVTGKTQTFMYFFIANLT